jgi:hypothetical protein
MKVGDLVRCISAESIIGLIVSIKPNVYDAVTKRSIFNVLLSGEIYPFRPDMLEVISKNKS